MFWYNFDTVLYQFLETGISDRTLIGLDQLLKFLVFSLYPLPFFLLSPFKRLIEDRLLFPLAVFIQFGKV